MVARFRSKPGIASLQKESPRGSTLTFTHNSHAFGRREPNRVMALTSASSIENGFHGNMV